VVLQQQELRSLSREDSGNLEDRDAAEVIAWTLERFRRRAAICISFRQKGWLSWTWRAA
jgi:hypothetical protein